MILPIEKQVCTLDSAKRLKELGFPQESLFYWEFIKPGYEDGTKNPCLTYYKNGCEGPYEGKTYIYYSAYTVAELGKFLNPGMKDRQGNPLQLKMWMYGEKYYALRYEPPRKYDAGINVPFEAISSLNESEARAKMLIYLKENNLI